MRNHALADENARLKAELAELREAADNVRLYTWGIVTANAAAPHVTGRQLLLRLDKALTGRQTEST